MSIRYRVALLVGFIALCQVTLAQSQIKSDFSVDNDGWTIFNTSNGSSTAAHWNSAGGNPTGYIDDNGTSGGGTILYAEAPAKFKGNQSNAYKQNFSFDIKESNPGSDVVNGDVVIQNSAAGITLFYMLPSNPTTSFVNHVVQLVETFTGWHYSSPTGPAPTKDQMKAVLSNITSFRIRTKHITTNTFTVTGSIDNVILNVVGLGTPPSILSISPTTALTGASVTITGINFNTTASQNAVFFNGVKATVTTASATQLIVKVPNSAAPGPVTVSDVSTGLQAMSKQTFNLLFDNNKDYGGMIIPATMLRGNSTFIPQGNNSNNFGSIDKADFDGDGWVDFVVTETATNKVFAYRNLGTGGTVSAASFGSAITLPTLSTVPGGGPSLTNMKVADIDSDGKVDVVVLCSGNPGTSYFTVFQNTSTSGTISFAAAQYFPMPFYSTLKVHTSDIDGDGRIDLLACTGTSPSNLYVARNQSTPGNVDFEYGQLFGPNTGFAAIGTGDMDNDGKDEIILANSNKFVFLTNNSVPGSISLTTNFTLTANIATSATTNFRVIDMDNDLNPDLVWTANNGNIYAKGNLHDTGPLTAASFSSDFVFSSALNSTSDLNVGDINADGKPDIVGVGLYDMAIFQNVGTGLLNTSYFMSGRVFQGSASGAILSNVGPVIADLDGDNKAEVVMAYSASGASAAEKGIYIFHNESFPVPVITNLSPTSAGLGTTIATNGSLLNTGTSTSPVVRIGTQVATSTPLGNTETDFTVPLGAIGGKVHYTNHGLTSVGKPLQYTFNTNRIINSSTFSSSVDFALAFNTRDALAVGDFDDDGRVDVMATENFNNLRIFQNSQAIAGTPITSSSLTLLGTTLTGGFNSTVYDIDGDGKTDIVSGSGIYKNTSPAGSITFGSLVNSGVGGNRYSVSDINKDGKLDYVIANASTNVTISENLSSRGNFVAVNASYTFGQSATNLPTQTGSLGLATADFDGDGYDDIIAANQSSNSITIYLNSKVAGPITTSSFALLGHYSSSGSQPNGLAASDFDGDGKIDLAISYFNSAFVSVYRNISSPGDISFATAVDLPSTNKGYNLAAQDLDGDGASEIVVIHRPNPGPGSFTVFKNNSSSGSISFAGGVNFALTRNPQALAIGDINSDTKPDILIVGDGGASSPANALTIFENKITSLFDNNRIIYSRTDGTIWSTAGDGSADKQLASGYRPHLSPDGRYLLYVNGPTPASSFQNSIYTKDLLTNVVTKVYNNTSDYIVSTAWSPDGSKIYFDYSCNMWSMNRDGSGVVSITGSNCYDDVPAVRLTDGAVAFHNQFNGLFFMNSDGSGRVAIPNTAPNDYWSSWSPDGQWIVFGRYASPSGPLVNIFKIKPDGSGLTQLTNLGAGDVINFGWVVSNDGLNLLASGTLGCATGIFQFPMDGSQTFKLINNAGSAGVIDFVGSEIGTPPLAYISPTGIPTITSITPSSSSPGWTVVISGSNFNATAANNTVKFNGTTAIVSSATPGALTVIVPTSATTGSVTVTTSCGTATSPGVFNISPVTYNACRNVTRNMLW